MFKQYKFENNVMDNFSLEVVTLMLLLLTFLLSSFLEKIVVTHLFKKGSHCICLSVILLDSVFKIGENY